jgi:hypothetical protein
LMQSIHEYVFSDHVARLPSLQPQLQPFIGPRLASSWSVVPEERVFHCDELQH